MSIATTITALQTLHAAITGITAAPTAYPSVINTSRLPLVLVWPGEATWNLAALNLERQERTYIVRCYVKPVGQDKAGPENGYAAARDLLEDFADAYLDDPTLGGVVDTMTSISDSGIVAGGPDLTWGDVPYWGFTYRLTIVEKA